MPINNVAMAESAFRAHFQYLVAAKARQRQREAIAHGREGLSLAQHPSCQARLAAVAGARGPS